MITEWKLQKKSNSVRALGIIVFGIAFVLSILRCFYAIDNDERLMTIVATQIAQGQDLFGDTWASYQTSAMLIAPFLKCYIFIHGSVEGIVLAYRVISVFLSLILSGVIYKVLKIIYSKISAYVCSLIFFLTLPVGAINADYRLLQMWFVTLTVCILLLLLKKQKDISLFYKIILCLLLGILWSGAVLCYPYLCIVTVMIIYILLHNLTEDRWKLAVTFLSSCFVMAGLFLWRIFANVTVDEFLEAVRNILNDPTHHLNLLKIFGLFHVRLLLKYVVMLVVCAVIFLAWRWVCKHYNYDTNRDETLRTIALTPLVGYFLIMCGGNVTGLYISGYCGVSVVYLAIAIMSFMMCYYKKDRLLINIWLLGILVYLITVYQGNVSAKDYLGFLYVAVYVLVLSFDDIWDSYQGGSRWLYVIAIISFCAGLLYTKAFNAREVDGVSSTIFEEREQCKSGPLKYIYLYPKYLEPLQAKEQTIQATTTEEDTILVISMDELMCLMGKGNYVYVTVTDYISFFQKDVRWQNWLDSPYHNKVTKFYLDKDYIGDIDSFMLEGLGQYITEHYQINQKIDTDHFRILEVTDYD